ncbi:MAG: PHP domain-containing protein [Armatimonadetes bacterium]|nr:PHP domain-containing protein [Armatimonadota bacterium]
MIDLHSHTVCSDGTLTPAELVAAAAAAGLRALAITDHDNVDAYDRLPDDRQDVEIIVGVELSLTWARGNLHLLGYHIDPHHAGLRTVLAQLQAARRVRNVTMVERLNAAGFAVTMEQLDRLAGGEQIGRPHMAQAMVELGAVSSIYQAFERYLADDSPLYVPREDLSPGDAIELVHAAGGAAVLAHPCQTRLSPADLADTLSRWVARGLDGLEVYYPQHTPRQRRLYRDLATRWRLAITVGSDFHGATKPGVRLGQVPGRVPDDDEVLDRLRGAAERHR